MNSAATLPVVEFVTWDFGGVHVLMSKRHFDILQADHEGCWNDHTEAYRQGVRWFTFASKNWFDKRAHLKPSGRDLSQVLTGTLDDLKFIHGWLRGLCAGKVDHRGEPAPQSYVVTVVRPLFTPFSSTNPLTLRTEISEGCYGIDTEDTEQAFGLPFAEPGDHFSQGGWYEGVRNIYFKVIARGIHTPRTLTYVEYMTGVTALRYGKLYLGVQRCAVDSIPDRVRTTFANVTPDFVAVLQTLDDAVYRTLSGPDANLDCFRIS